MPSIVTVSQLNRYLALKLGNDPKLRGVTVRGEISNFNIHYKSGHAYFSLKDDQSLIKCVMFSRSAARLSFTPQNGMSVICSGNVEVYEAGGAYQIIASELVPVGIGAKFMQLNELKKRLAEMGVFAQERKKPLPQLPRKIAVVTSLNGAALQDILNVLKRRYPVGAIEIFAAQVQGERADVTIGAALKRADSSGADVIILARGGGSGEDLMPFNSELVVLAISECRTPLISAVGHETDTSLSDYAADLRAPTPSAAAELCAPDMTVLKSTLLLMQKRLDEAFAASLDMRRQSLHGLSARVHYASPQKNLDAARRRQNELAKRAEAALTNQLSARRALLEKNTAALSALSPYRVLERGYAITLKNGTPITRAVELRENDEIIIRYRDFAVSAKVTSVDTEVEKI